MVSKKVSRRSFLQSTGVGAIALLGGSFHPFGRSLPFSKLTHSGAIGIPRVRAQMEPFMPDAEISITAAEKWV